MKYLTRKDDKACDKNLSFKFEKKTLAKTHAILLILFRWITENSEKNPNTQFSSRENRGKRKMKYKTKTFSVKLQQNLTTKYGPTAITLKAVHHFKKFLYYFWSSVHQSKTLSISKSENEQQK